MNIESSLGDVTVWMVSQAITQASESARYSGGQGGDTPPEIPRISGIAWHHQDEPRTELRQSLR
jgi:hypothetical protein